MVHPLIFRDSGKGEFGVGAKFSVKAALSGEGCGIVPEDRMSLDYDGLPCGVVSPFKGDVAADGESTLRSQSHLCAGGAECYIEECRDKYC